MMGFVVLCLIFLVIPGQEVNANSTVAPKTENTSTTETIMLTEQTTGHSSTTEMVTSKTEVPTTSDNDTRTLDSLITSVDGPTSSMNANSTVTPETENTSTTEVPPVTAATEVPPVTAATEVPPVTAATEVTAASDNDTRTPDSLITSADGPTSSKPPEKCSSDPCGKGSSCLQLHNTYVCRCPFNYHYNMSSKTCNGAQTFLGEFTINGGNVDFKTETPEYTDLYNKVLNQCNVSLFDLDPPAYLGTNIIRISLNPSTFETRSRRSAGDVYAKVSHLFTKEATITSEQVTEAINNGSFVGTYVSQSICDGFYCDPESTNCTETDNGQAAICICKQGRYVFSANDEVTTSCRECSPECYKAEGAYCNVESKDDEKCACLSGYKGTWQKCEKCDFGYSGENCADSNLLILIIIGAVLGVAVIALLGAVIGVSISSKKGKKYGDRTALIDEDDSTSAERNPAPTRLFPKVQAKTDVGQVNTAANVYEGNEEFNRNLPKRDYDENPWYEMDRRGRNY